MCSRWPQNGILLKDPNALPHNDGALAYSWSWGLGYILLTAMHCLRHYGRALRLYGSYARGRKRPWHVIVDFSSLSYSYNIRNPARSTRLQAGIHPPIIRGRAGSAQCEGWTMNISASVCSAAAPAPAPASAAAPTPAILVNVNVSVIVIVAGQLPRCSSHKLHICVRESQLPKHTL